ncbi:MAG: S46 family peptidase [Bryobacterales bacterium]|nr:S46 family peptidase [Bryobacteraceae bacterium]MDW8130188.1 S46 family peptidase [Bryobacterales bacterium]
MKIRSKLALSVLLVWTWPPLEADEGIWLFEAFPRKRVAAKYGFEVADGFLDRLRLASLRVGASGSFVSADGLIFTNHHVALDCLQKLSTKENNYVVDGFWAPTQADEKPCPDLEANQLVRIQDVTERVNAAVKPGAPDAEALRQRQAEIARIEKECTTATGNRCDVVNLYSGGRYHLYEYKKYTDLRMVFAPESDIGFFGGDPDNFTYPRYCLDIAFLRAYENGKPARTPHYLKFSREGVKEGELIFVSGNPGTTGRLMTVAQLEFLRDHYYPLIHRRLASLIRTLENYSAQSPDNERVAHDNLFSQQNSYKAYTGFLAGLRDPKIMDLKRAEEKKLRAAVEADPDRKARFGGAWDAVAAAYGKFRDYYKTYWLLEFNPHRGTDLLRIARDVLRLAEERQKPDDQRLREYRDSALPSLERQLYSPAPITDSMEIAVLADYFEFLRAELGADDPTVRAILDGRSAQQAAEAYVGASRLKDVAERKRLAADVEAVRSSQDGMIRLARLLDARARQLRKRFEDEVEAVLTSSAAKIAQARFAIFGEDAYPDATFTLRLSYGAVRGYKDQKGRAVPYATTFEGLYKRATGKPPYRLPKRWLEARSKLNLKTPFNFVSTADTHGGNSGSPTVNTRGEIVGILFDGNIESLPNRFVYTEERARSVHVATQGIREALDKVYGAHRLLAELGLK